MITNVLITLTWILTTNSVVISKVKTTDMLTGNALNGNVWWNSGIITTTTRHTVTSNLIGKFTAFGQVFTLDTQQSVAVTNWTTQESWPDQGYFNMDAVNAVTTP